MEDRVTPSHSFSGRESEGSVTDIEVYIPVKCRLSSSKSPPRDGDGSR